MPPRRSLPWTVFALGVALAGLLGLTAAPATATATFRATPMEGLDTGGFHTSAIRAGAVWCWGSDGSGQLGDGPKLGSTSTPLPVRTASTPLAGQEVVQVVTGQSHTCALTRASVVACWGSNSLGQLGDGTTTRRHVPTEVVTQGTSLERADIVELAVGLMHTCARTARGALACWGHNGDGELGNGTTDNATVPKGVSTTGPLAGQYVHSVAAGDNSTCAATSRGQVVCWGGNDHGQLGDGTYAPSLVPTTVTTAQTPLDRQQVVEVSMARSTACARTADDVLACWGRNDHGQVGDNAGAANQNLPVAVTTAGTPLAGSTAVDISRGAEQHCALLEDGTVACWGLNDEGQLGDGTTVDRRVPTALATAGTGLAGAPITEVTLGYEHTCALRKDGQPFCWGNNVAGQLGDGTMTDSLTPVAVVL